MNSKDIPFILAFAAAALILIETVFSYGKLQPVIPMFYSLTNTEDQLVSKQFVFIFPILAILILFIHIPLQSYLQKHDMFDSVVFSWSTTIVEILLVIAYTRILLLVI